MEHEKRCARFVHCNANVLESFFKASDDWLQLHVPCRRTVHHAGKAGSAGTVPQCIVSFFFKEAVSVEEDTLLTWDNSCQRIAQIRIFVTISRRRYQDRSDRSKYVVKGEHDGVWGCTRHHTN